MKQCKIAIIAQANVDLFVERLREGLKKWLPSIDFSFYTVPFGQAQQMLVDPTSPLAMFQADFTYFMDFFEDYYDPYFDAFFSEESIIKRYESYLALIRYYREINHGILFVQYPHNLISIAAVLSATSVVSQLKKIFDNHMLNLSDVVQIDLEHVMKVFPKKIIDSRLKFIGRFYFSDDFSEALSNQFIRKIAHNFAKTIRLIIVDLDNTLWGGVAGEDGVDGIEIGGDFPGNCYSCFQNFLKLLKTRGILLAIASKNDQQLIEETFAKRSMPLSFDDFIAKKINWENKSENILSISAEIGIGLENILFIDDSAIECAVVKMMLPSLHVIAVPSDPTCLLETVANFILLETSSVNQHDLMRVDSYVQRNKLLSDRSKVSNLEGFYSSLDLHISLDLLSPNNLNRVIQLFQKTNQFNMTGKRYNKNDLYMVQENNGLVIVVRVKDCYSVDEIMGALVLKKETSDIWSIENYVMSCRSLGKQVESIVLKEIINFLYQAGAKQLWGAIVFTDRNLPVQGIYEQLDFELYEQQQNESKWRLALEKQIIIQTWARCSNNIILENQYGAPRSG